MKPWEETWDVDGPWLKSDEDNVIADFGSARTGQQSARARLAAQAPAMARLLLAKLYEDGWSCCPDGFNGNHVAECEVVAVLSAAGVLDAGAGK